MKIGFSTFVMQGGRTGVASYIINLLKYLQEEDTENAYDILISEDEQDLVPVHAPNFRRVPFAPFLNKPIPSILWHNTGLPLRSRGEKYDLVHIPSYRRIPRIKGTRVVATVHDLATFSIDAKYDKARMFYNRKIVPGMIRTADHVITVSHYTKNDIVRLIGYPEEKITVIYSGINRDLFQPMDPGRARAQVKEKYGIEEPFIVFVSRVEHPAKNHLNLVKAFEAFKAERRGDLKLVFAGADWNGAEFVKDYVDQSMVKDDVHFLGFVPFEDIPVLYSACRLMAYPSFFEGFGFPVIEALACGAQAICSNTSSLKELAKDIVPTFTPDTPGEIREAMEEALANPWHEEERQRALDYAGTFDWNEAARSVMRVYAEVGGQPS